MAYNDLQEYLTRLESAGKLHWIEQRVDPAWEVTAITRQVFDRYGWAFAKSASANFPW